MGVFDWVSSMMGLVAIKLAESITSEKVKNWIDKGKSTSAKKALVDLYECIIVLEYSSAKFVELLDSFIQFASMRNGEHAKVSDNWRWRESGWGSLLAKQAKEVAEHMQSVSNALQKLYPRVEIYLPEVAEYMEKFEIYTQGEQFISAKVQEAMSELNEIEIKDFRIVAKKTSEAVEGLAKTKNHLQNLSGVNFLLKNGRTMRKSTTHLENAASKRTAPNKACT